MMARLNRADRGKERYDIQNSILTVDHLIHETIYNTKLLINFSTPETPVGNMAFMVARSRAEISVSYFAVLSNILFSKI